MEKFFKEQFWTAMPTICLLRVRPPFFLPYFSKMEYDYQNHISCIIFK